MYLMKILLKLNGDQITETRCFLSVIYQEGDLENIENMRPILLLNIDYRLAVAF